MMVTQPDGSREELPPPLPASPAPPPKGARRRRALWLALVAVTLVALPGTAWLLANRESTRLALLRRAELALSSRLPGARIGATLRIDARFRLVLGPVVVPARRTGAPPVVTVQTVRLRPRWRALLLGRPEVAIVSLEGVTVEAGRRADELRALAERLRAKPDAAPARGGTQGAEPPVVRFSELRVRGLAPGGVRLELGPMSGDVRRDGDALAARVRLPGDGRVTARLEPRAGGPALSVRFEELAPAALPEALARRFPGELPSGRLSGTVESERVTASGARLDWTLRLDDLTVRAPRLAAEPVGPLSLDAAGAAEVDVAAGALRLSDARLRVGSDPRATLVVDASVSARGDHPFELRVRGEDVDWRALVGHLPAALAPGGAAPEVSGRLGLRLHVAGPLRRPSAWRLEGDVDLARLSSPGGAPALERPFRHRAHLAGGASREVLVGPENPRFTPLATLPPHVFRAVTIAEDAGFFAHRGFDFHELSNALADGARSGRLGRGASTISQQVAKNLWLTPERTLARKAREALLTVALEASTPKRRILEIYLNVAEWGPGIVGLGEAARHYFGKEPASLSAREAAFLASIIPNPVRFHMYCARGETTPAWDARIDDLLYKLWSTGVLDDDQLAEALVERLAFAHG